MASAAKCLLPGVSATSPRARLLAQFGETGAVDLMATMGYYQLVCMLLNVDEYPLRDGEAANFPTTRS